jgi:hypothetical protein
MNNCPTCGHRMILIKDVVGQAVRADETTVIKRDNDADKSTTVVKKKIEVAPLPVPHVGRSELLPLLFSMIGKKSGNPGCWAAARGALTY